MADLEHNTEEVTHEDAVVESAPLPEGERGERSSSQGSPIPVIPQLSVALGLLVFVFSVTYVGATKVTPKTPPHDVRVERQITTQTNDDAQSNYNAYDNVSLQAKSAIVWDVKTQRILFNKNADDVRPLASITKLMTALVAYELLDPEDKISISEHALHTEGDSGFKDGEEFTMQNLSDLTLIESSNDGATALGATAGNIVTSSANPDAVFVKAMNLKAEELGLSNMSFKNSTGLDVSPTEAGAYGSARDVALLMEYIITNIPDAVALTTIDVTSINNEKGAYHVVKNTNEVVDSIEGLIASKTGYTELSGGNLVVAANIGLNRPVVVVVLGSSQNGRFKDTLALLDATRTHIGNQAK